MQDMVNKMGLEDLFEIDSRATSREEIGNPPHHGTVKKMQEVGIPVIPHQATQITQQDYEEYDYIIGMDDWNMRNLNRMLQNDPDCKMYKLLSFAGRTDDIADPWYTGNFDVTYDDVREGCTALLQHILNNEK
jgi:protein-tyrosine phosphatase